jgi:hypothetical protein
MLTARGLLGMMLSDTEIRTTRFGCALDEGQAGEFIALIQREPFDYTEWHRSLWPDKSIEEFSRRAMEHRRESKRGQIETGTQLVVQHSGLGAPSPVRLAARYPRSSGP